MSLVWKQNETASELHSMLEILGEEYPIIESGRGSRIFFKHVEGSESLQVKSKGGEWFVKYGTKMAAARGVAYALAGMEAKETIAFKTFGILLDCTRNRVL